MPDTPQAAEFPEYATYISKPAKDARRNLPRSLQETIYNIIDELAEDPDNNRRGIKKISPGGKATVYVCLYENRQAGLQITYQVDKDKKVIHVMHFAEVKIRGSS